MSEKLSSGPRIGYDASRVGAGLTRGPGMRKKLTAAAWSNTWPAPGATLDLDFANNRGFVRGVGQGGVMDAITFTRASNGTFVGSNGQLAGSGSDKGALGLNLLTFPQNFENAVWGKENCSIVSDALVAPDGTKTADQFVTQAISTAQRISFASGTLTVSSSYSLTVYVKQTSTYRYVFFRNPLNLGDNIGFDLGTGTITYNGTTASASIIFVGDGWYRIGASGVVTTASSTMYIGLSGSPVTSSASPGIAGDGVNGFAIWGAQLELGSSATIYYPTNINAPRFDWASTAQLPQNLFNYTQQFNLTYWTTGGSNLTIADNSVTAPDGTSTAATFTDNSTNGQHCVQATTPSLVAGVYTQSVYAKAGTSNFIALYNGFATAGGIFNVSTGVYVGPIVGAPLSANITNEGNGWYRCSITYNVAGGNQPPRINTSNGSAISYVGSGQTVYVWGSQFELGSTVTTYKANTGAFIPTNTPLAAAATCNGLLIEESRTNRLLWCRDAAQSDWTKTNITAAKTATGIDGVSNAASSLTATADGGTCIQTVTLASGSRTCSIFLNRITGTGNVQVSLDGTTWSTVDLSNGLYNRIVLSGTVTNPVVGIRLATNGDAVAMDYGQIEDGAFATTPILTTTATATRSADLPTNSGANFLTWFDPSKGTLYAQSVSRYTAGSCAAVSLGTSIDGFYLRPQSATVQGQISLASTNLAVYVGTAIQNNQQSNLCLSYRINDFSFSNTGGNQPVNNNNGVSSRLPSVSKITIGSIDGATFLNGTVSRIIFFPRKYPLPAVQALTGGAT